MHDLAIIIPYVERKSEKYLPELVCSFSKFDIGLKDIDLSFSHVERNSQLRTLWHSCPFQWGYYVGLYCYNPWTKDLLEFLQTLTLKFMWAFCWDFVYILCKANVDFVQIISQILWIFSCGLCVDSPLFNQIFNMFKCNSNLVILCFIFCCI